MSALALVGLALLLLTSSWVLRYNLNVFYQLCDLFTYVSSSLLLIAFATRRRWTFFALSLPAMRNPGCPTTVPLHEATPSYHSNLPMRRATSCRTLIATRARSR